MILNLSAHFACSGSSSPTSMPGTFVRIGRKSPRYSLGASGFRSYISMCGGPPGSQTKITDRSSCAATVPAWACNRKMSPSVKPPKPIAPNFSAVRRVIGPGQPRDGSCMASSRAGEQKAGSTRRTRSRPPVATIVPTTETVWQGNQCTVFANERGAAVTGNPGQHRKVRRYSLRYESGLAMRSRRCGVFAGRATAAKSPNYHP